MVKINKDVTFMDISTNTPIRYDWNFGDGTVLTGITENPVTHQYTTPGDYIITHKVYNICGSSTNDCTKSLTVTELPTNGGSSAPVILAAAALGLLMMIKK